VLFVVVAFSNIQYYGSLHSDMYGSVWKSILHHCSCGKISNTNYSFMVRI